MATNSIAIIFTILFTMIGLMSYCANKGKSSKKHTELTLMTYVGFSIGAMCTLLMFV